MAVSAEQLHSLVKYCTDFAVEMLSKAGAFYPFGAKLNPDGTLEALGAHDGNEQPSPQDIYSLLANALRVGAQDGSVIGAAIAVDVNVPPQYESPFPDAVRVTLEAEGYSRHLYFPYSPAKRGLFKQSSASLKEPFAVEVEPEIFV